LSIRANQSHLSSRCGGDGSGLGILRFAPKLAAAYSWLCLSKAALSELKAANGESGSMPDLGAGAADWL
jgi:hypothetical protein